MGPIVDQDYAPCVVLAENSSVRVGGLESWKERRQAGSLSVHAPTILASLWETRAFADAILACRGRSFSIHRGIIACISPVWAAVFDESAQDIQNVGLRPPFPGVGSWGAPSPRTGPRHFKVFAATADGLQEFLR